MGSTISRIIDARRDHHVALSLAISRSVYIDPRHLEHFTYAMWNSVLNALVHDRRGSTGTIDLMVIPQLPIWHSKPDNDNFLDGLEANDSMLSNPDGSARSVYIDYAIIFPLLKLRPLAELPKETQKQYIRRTLADILATRAVTDFPRFFRVEGLCAPLLVEAKTGPHRHPRDLKSFVKNLVSILQIAQTQAESQAYLLFSSWRFEYQGFTYVLAVFEEYWSIRRLTRAWARDLCAEHDVKQDGVTSLVEMRAGLALDPSPRHDPAGKVESGLDEIDEAFSRLHGHFYPKPDDVSAAKSFLEQALAKGADQRNADRARRKAQQAVAASGPDPNILPNHTDRSAPLFEDSAIDRFRLSQTGEEAFFETRLPEQLFSANDAEKSDWSRFLRLGTNMSDKYMKYLSNVLYKFEHLELTRRENCKLA